MTELAARSFSLEPFDYGEARALMDGLGLAEPVAVTLVRRGYRTVEAAGAFLAAADDHDPFLFKAMAEVCDRLHVAITTGRLITVHGDYDVDGVCSTAILVRAIRELGGNCDWLIPGRLEDGYGLTQATVERLAGRGTAMLLTTDCGIGSVDEVGAALDAGIEVIVTDHHQPGDELPPCPILHPALSGYPFSELCATGVAYKLAAALRGERAAEADLDLVALATVADLVPLRGENRALVRRGLEVARRARRPGLRALLASASVAPERLDEGDFAFRLGPRINAAGRLYRADAGVELMLTDDFARAEQIAAELERANRERRAVELEVLGAAERSRVELPPELADAAGLVLAGEGWHAGVVGIVASRIVERHRRPAVLIGLDADGNGRGSGRSIPGFDLLGALQACSSHLTRFGGHRAAAGLEIAAGEIEAFRAAFAAHCAAELEGIPTPSVEVVDAVVGGESLGHDVAEQLRRLAPFGNGNPGVRLLVPGAKLGEVRPMGEGDRHARFVITSGARRALGVAFGVNGSLDAAAASGPLDLSVELELNEWNGAIEPRVVLGDRLSPGERDPSADPPAPGREAEEAGGIGFERVLAALRAGALVRAAAVAGPVRHASGQAGGRRPPRCVGRGDDRRARLQRRGGVGAVRGCRAPAGPRRERRATGAVWRWRAGDRLGAARRRSRRRGRGAGHDGGLRRRARRLGGPCPRPGPRRSLRASGRRRPAAVRPSRAAVRGGRGLSAPAQRRGRARVRAARARRRVAVSKLARRALPCAGRTARNRPRRGGHPRPALR